MTRTIARGITARSPIARGITARSPFAIASPFTPGFLFEDGEQGVWYEPKPVISGQQILYQDAAGTIPVTADGDPVGYMRDLSGNGNHATQATSAARPLYRTDGTLHWLEGDGVDDILTVPGSKTALSFLSDGTGATLQMTFGKTWTAGDLDLLCGTAFYSSASNGLDLFIDDRAERVRRLRSVNPGGIDSTSLDNSVTDSRPAVIEFRQDGTGQAYSTSEGAFVSRSVSSGTTDNDLRIFGIPGEQGETENHLISSGILTFHGGIIVSERLSDLTDTRRYLANLAGIQL